MKRLFVIATGSAGKIRDFAHILGTDHYEFKSPDLAIEYLFFAQIAFRKQSCQIFQVILKFLQYNAGSEAEHRFRIDFNPHFPISISLFPNVLISDAHTDCPGSPFFLQF